MDDLVRRFLEDEIPALAPTLADDDDLLRPGVLDSLAIVRLVATLEDELGIVIDESEIHPDHFRSVARIRAFLATKS